MIQISTTTLTVLGLLLAASSALAGGAVAWGVLRQTVTQLRELVHELREDVTALRDEVVTLTRTVAVLQDRSDRQPTGQHPRAS